MSWELQQARANREIHALIEAVRGPHSATDDPGTRLVDIIRAEDYPPVLSPTIVSLLRAGAVKRLRRIVQDVSELGPMCTCLPNNSMTKDRSSLFWSFAITALSELSDRLLVAVQADSQQAELHQAWVDWRATAERIFLSFKNYNFLEGLLESKSENEQTLYRAFMVTSINALSPLFDGRFSEIEVNVSKDSWEEFIRIMLRVRAFLSGGPPTIVDVDVARSILKCTTILTNCFMAHSTTTRLGMPTLSLWTPINAPGLTGLGYDSLIRPFLSLCPLILAQTPATQLQNRFAQFEFIMVLAREYRTESFVRAFITLGCFAHSATLFRDLRASPDYQINNDTKHMDIACYNLCISTWRDVLQDVRSDKRDEVLDAKILFLIEWWSFHAFDERLYHLSDIASFMSEMLTLSDDISTSTKHVQQLRTISQRMSSRPDVRPRLAELWKKTYSDLGQSKRLAPSVTEESDMCAMIGCESVEPAESRCGRCGKALYCSETCQLSDWKAHKSHCVPKKRT